MRADEVLNTILCKYGSQVWTFGRMVERSENLAKTKIAERLSICDRHMIATVIVAREKLNRWLGEVWSGRRPVPFLLWQLVMPPSPSSSSSFLSSLSWWLFLFCSILHTCMLISDRINMRNTHPYYRLLIIIICYLKTLNLELKPRKTRVIKDFFFKVMTVRLLIFMTRGHLLEMSLREIFDRYHDYTRVCTHVYVKKCSAFM